LTLRHFEIFGLQPLKGIEGHVPLTGKIVRAVIAMISQLIAFVRTSSPMQPILGDAAPQPKLDYVRFLLLL